MVSRTLLVGPRESQEGEQPHSAAAEPPSRKAARPVWSSTLLDQRLAALFAQKRALSPGVGVVPRIKVEKPEPLPPWVMPKLGESKF